MHLHWRKCPRRVDSTAKAAKAVMSFLLRLLLVVGTLTWLALREDGRKPERAFEETKERLRTDAQAMAGKTVERFAREATAREVAKLAGPIVAQAAKTAGSPRPAAMPQR